MDFSLNELKKAVIEFLPSAVRSESSNGREFVSEYFSIRGGEYEKFENQSIRHYVHVLIMGDRRPYRVDVIVVKERRNREGIYEKDRFDNKVAKKISKEIQRALNKRRGGRNVIDDFRPF
ncbi:MAG: hypothetical protein A2Z20_05940 [Bdellovibrionales bacterium RBG_16_40_8]|nr:MAG: hypothetical protein A2Z20_05940 [Bdellovibrionales bacterium RBG_16_40_8]